MISHQATVTVTVCLGTTLLLVRVCEGSSSCAVGHTKLVDNWREVQPVGNHRTVYRSAAAASSCPDTCDKADVLGVSNSYVSATCPVDRTMTATERTLDTTTNLRWT